MFSKRKIEKEKLIAPLSGIMVPINEVPDPVFAEKLLGEGIAIDPVSEELLAPCNAEILHLHPAHHAVTMRTSHGAEILIHIGLDTVIMKGDGFKALIEAGQIVKKGQPLIRFNADKIATTARSLLTTIVITNSDAFGVEASAPGYVKGGDSEVMFLQSLDKGPSVAQFEQQKITSESLDVPNPQGWHARPAAILAKTANRYSNRILIEHNMQSVDAKSVTALMALDVQFADKVRIVTAGSNAKTIIQALSEQISSGLGESLDISDEMEETLYSAEEPSLMAKNQEDPNILKGIPASPGLVIGQVVRYKDTSWDLQIVEHASDAEEELDALERAILTSMKELQELVVRLASQGKPAQAEIFSAHQVLLQDPNLAEQAENLILQGKSAAWAWDTVCKEQAEHLQNVDNELIVGRAADIIDVSQRVLKTLFGIDDSEREFPENSIIIARDLSPSETADLGHHKVIGFGTTRGGATSHAAILASAMSLPAVTGLDYRVLNLEDGEHVVLDGDKGILYTHLDNDFIEQIQQRQEDNHQNKQLAQSKANQPAITRDGIRIGVATNIASDGEISEAVRCGAEGIGLLRSEFLYLGQLTEPSEQQQAETYQQIAKQLAPGQPMIVRTLDIGGDKFLPYLRLPKEENPFLGERGIRIGLHRPGMLRRQIRAILSAYRFADVRIMFPMVATLPEFRAAKGLVKEEAEKLGFHNIKVGIMVEIPSTALMAEVFAREADFFSIGTNDLTQYVLAMDRGHPKLGSQTDALSPAVLKLIHATVVGARTAGKWVGVCGSAASDLQAIPILLGLGITELSCSHPVIPQVKERIRQLNMIECKQLAQHALALDDAEQVRSMLARSQLGEGHASA